MNQSDKYNKWHALYVRPKQEKKVAKLFEFQNITHYLPLLKVKKQWSDRVKTVEEPLFRSYIFCPEEVFKNHNLKHFDGVINYVDFSGKLATIHQYEIDNIKDFLGELIVTEDQYNQIGIGHTVEIKRGAFVGKQGEVIMKKNNKLTLTVESLGYHIDLSIDINGVKKIK